MGIDRKEAQRAKKTNGNKQPQEVGVRGTSPENTRDSVRGDSQDSLYVTFTKMPNIEERELKVSTFSR